MIRLEVIGNLGADVEKRVQNGSTFFTFRVAHSEKKVSQNTGEVTTETTWISCSCNYISDKLLEYLKKGTKVFVRGFVSFKMFKYDHEQRIGINLFATEIELCGGKQNESEPKTKENEQEKQENEQENVSNLPF